MNKDLAVKHVTLPVMCFVMVLGNGALIFIMVRHKRLRTVTNFFISSLALSDLMMGCLVLPLLVSAEEGALGNDLRLCLLIFCVTISQILISCMVLMSIAVERYIAITRPLKHHCYVTRKNAAIIIALCWLYGILIGSLPLWGWNSLGSETDHINQTVLCRYQQVIAGSYAAFMFPGHFVPLWLLMMILYGRIYLKTRHRESVSAYRLNVRRLSNVLIAPRERKTFSLRRARENWRALRILAILVGYFLFSWLPVVVWYASLYKGFTKEDAHYQYQSPPLPYWFYNISITLAYGNSAVNPVLYGLGNRSVRKACLLMLPCWSRPPRGAMTVANSPHCSPTLSPNKTAVRRTRTLTVGNNQQAARQQKDSETKPRWSTL